MLSKFGEEMISRVGMEFTWFVQKCLEVIHEIHDGDGLPVGSFYTSMYTMLKQHNWALSKS